jgi:hypothetical protein
MRAYYKQLIAVRREHVALTRGGFTLLTGPQDPVLAFLRRDAASSDQVLVLANRDDRPVEVEVPAGELWGAPAARDRLAGDNVALVDGRLRVTVPAKSARLFVPSQP